MPKRIVLLSVAASLFLSHQSPANEVKEPDQFKIIKVRPANIKELNVSFNINHDGDGQGEELPSSVSYYKKNTQDFATSMAVTDISLCKRDIEKKICESFVKLQTDKSMETGLNVTDSRIFGAGYNTFFIKKVDAIKISWADTYIAFLGADSQDPPATSVTLYIYAKEGNNLVQLYGPVASSCGTSPYPTKKENYADYYKKNCGTEENIKKAVAEAEQLSKVFEIPK